MEKAFIDSQQLQKAIHSFANDAPVYLTLFCKVRGIASYADASLVRSGVDALNRFSDELSPALHQAKGSLIHKSSGCLSLSGEQNWDHQLILEFGNIDGLIHLLSLEHFQQTLVHFYAGSSAFESYLSQ